MTNKNITLLVSWNIIKYKNKYFLTSTHYIYLQYLVMKLNYSHIYIISPVKENETNVPNKTKIKFNNVHVIELPYSTSYISALKNIYSYYTILKKISKVTNIFYCRVPDPFSWMPQLIFKKKTIMHYVGDSIEVIKNNENWNIIRKTIMIIGYLPDLLLTILASKKSIVYTNGIHIHNKLLKYKIDSKVVISSTINSNSLINNPIINKRSKDRVKLIYLGHIRYSKGINCLINLLNLMKKCCFDFIFNIVGDGEMYDILHKHIITNDLTEKVVLYGFINDRKKIKKIIQESDLFIFPSLSEGSPRVIIEAMAWGTPVISTPVGSLPFCFEDKKEIRYFDFDNYFKAFEIIKEYTSNEFEFNLLRYNAYNKIKKEFTIENFLSQIFNYDT